MKPIQRLRATKGLIYRVQNLWLAVIIMFLAPLVFADDQTKEKGKNQIDEQIQIVADKLVTNDAEKYAEFMGDVRASQGNLTITSEHLRIYYKDNLDNPQNQIGSRESIKRIVARGRVKISSDQYTAETEQAEYDLDTAILVLQGENSTITRGKNSITGSKITVHRKDGQIVVERGAEQRVKARFYSKDVQREE